MERVWVKKKAARLLERAAFCNLQVMNPLFGRIRLLSDTEFLLGDDGTVAVDVLADQVVEKTTTLTYQSLESSCCRIIFVI